MTLKEQALRLYTTAFPSDSIDFATDFINRFFDKHCRYIVAEGKIVSMLFLFDCSLVLKGERHSAYYLYAAATLPEYRGRGLMADLVEKAKKEAFKKGRVLITKPAAEGLFGFYSKFGFKTAFYYSKELLERQNIDNLCEITTAEYILKREELLKDTPHVCLDDLMEFALGGMRLFGDDNTCCCVDMSGERPLFKEYLSKAEIGESLKTPFAMLCLFDATPLPDKMYMGLAMD